MLDDLEFLESYLITEYDAEVVWGKDEADAYYYDVNCIGIRTTRRKEIQLFCLLHEAGHLILRKDENFKSNYPDVHKDGRTQLSRVDTIKEEIDAWSEGRKLAKKLGIEIDDRRWNRYWKHQVYKYVKWAVDKER
tara:strand:+ start:93 stop:497 length:405 start_codon:yes stop_codon:yes gene_type:complete